MPTRLLGRVRQEGKWSIGGGYPTATLLCLVITYIPKTAPARGHMNYPQIPSTPVTGDWLWGPPSRRDTSYLALALLHGPLCPVCVYSYRQVTACVIWVSVAPRLRDGRSRHVRARSTRAAASCESQLGASWLAFGFAAADERGGPQAKAWKVAGTDAEVSRRARVETEAAEAVWWTLPTRQVSRGDSLGYSMVVLSRVDIPVAGSGDILHVVKTVIPCGT